MRSNTLMPSGQKLSVILAAVLLSFTVARFADIPRSEYSFNLAGILINIHISINTFIAFIVAGLTASGTDWIIRDHPKLSKSPSFKHWLVPGVTAWVLSLPLSIMTDNTLWFAGLLASGVVILLVIVSEYITADIQDLRHPIAETILTSIAFVLFFILSISLRTLALRLIYLIPAIGLASILISLRIINFRLPTQWLPDQSFVISLIIAQIAATLHYLLVSPITFGLILFGILYAMINFVVNFSQSSVIYSSAKESVFILMAVISLSFFV